MNNHQKEISLIGVSHHNLSLSQREQISLVGNKQHTLNQNLLNHSNTLEFITLNTCNRIEIYAVTPKPLLQSSINEIHQIFTPIINQPLDFCQKHGYIKHGQDALNHLFHVICGIDSQMVGETEISGQVKDAFHHHTQLNSIGPILNRSFQKAFQAAKWARTHTQIGQGQISIGNIACDLASRIFGELNQTRIMIIGSGDVGQRTLQAFKSHGVNDIAIVNRTFEKACTLAQEHQGVAIQLDQAHALMHTYDIIVCCTTSPKPILDINTLKPILTKRREDPLFLIDLGMPRNIDPQASTLHNTFAYNLDDLAQIANENLEARKANINLCSNILQERALHVWNSIQRFLTNDSNHCPEPKVPA